MINLTAATDAPGAVDVDALVVFSRTVSNEGPDGTVDAASAARPAGADAGGSAAALVDGHRLPREAVAHVEGVLAAVVASGGATETIKVTGTPGVKAPLVLVAGLGSAQPDQATAETWRRAAGNAARALAAHRDVAVVSPLAEEGVVAALAEGAGLGSYRYTHHLSDKVRAKRALREVGPVSVSVLTESEVASVADVISRAEVLVSRQGLARDLVNTGPNELYPETFANAVTEHATGLDTVSVEILDEAALREGGFGGIIGVGQGSERGPRLVRLAYTPGNSEETGRSVALVGKGITFDSGGLSLKPAGSMVTMKCDMAGAAAVTSAVLAAADLELPVAVTGYLALAENLPSASAQRPGDVVTMRDGTTVEIINTDAEGRLVLADALTWAVEHGSSSIVDVATLTGAAMVALGGRTAAIMANDDDLQADLVDAAALAGEPVWPMPIAEEIRKGMDSDVADIKHTGDKLGGAMVAAAFLREFVPTRTGAAVPNTPPEQAVAAEDAPGHIPWGHIDIAGPAFNEGSAYGYTPKGGTGYAVRTLVNFLEGQANPAGDE